MEPPIEGTFHFSAAGAARFHLETGKMSHALRRTPARRGQAQPWGEPQSAVSGQPTRRGDRRRNGKTKKERETPNPQGKEPPKERRNPFTSRRWEPHAITSTRDKIDADNQQGLPLARGGTPTTNHE